MTIEAIYANGVFKPLTPVHIPENQRVQVAWLDDCEPLDDPDMQERQFGPEFYGETWQANFEAIIQSAKSRAHLYPPGFEVDISRDAMYPDE
jgi:predicted DNA-binding antitoxin AbrB/MazE fold protein